jgi:DNA modification methylase
MTPFFVTKHVTLYCGDSLEVLRALRDEGERFDLLLTDPPYGINQAVHRPSGVNAKRGKGKYQGEMFEDTQTYLSKVVRPVVDTALRMSTLGIVTPGVGGWRHMPQPQEEGCMYMPASPGFNTWAHSDYQPIYYYGKPQGNTGEYRVLSHTVTERGYSNEHPCSKPLKFWKRLMLCGTDGVEGKRVLDPFAGSGTTGAAAQALGMEAVLIEINPYYCDLIARNLSQDVLF